MEQDPSMSWSDMPPPSADDEFSNFLEFNMQFPDLEGQHGPTDHLPSRSVAQQAAIATSTAPPQQQPMVCMNSDSVTDQSQSYTRMMADFPVELPGHGQQGIPPTSSYSNGPMTPAFYAQKSQMFHPSQQQQQPPPQSTSQPYIPQGQMMIPPTPISIELHGNAAPYPQRVGDNSEMYDRYSRMMEEQALYTPLVSPAMTPLENQFRQPEYTIPGEYFSPLSSPAIEAQHTNANGFPMHSAPMTDVNFVHSPVDSGFHLQSAPSSPGMARKHQRKRPSVSSKSFSSRAKKQQSPSVRPLTRTRSKLTDEVMTHLADGQVNPTSHPQNGNAQRYNSAESSGQDSVSPEPLSEPLMPPPALPPARKSPTIAPQARQQQNSSEPATPAMLMRMQRSPHTRSASDHNLTPTQLPVTEPHDDIMEDVILPEAATPSAQLFRPQPSRIDTTIPNSTSSPHVSANTTTHPERQQTSLSEKHSASIAPSPRSVAMPSPGGPVPRKSETPKLGPVNSRKRQSLSSSHPSPSLRPKISPNIQPLVSGDTSAAYLANLGMKSNYQQIIEGTLLPGVSYPETLAENLSSKRTNHKLAEQGRRNRINNALKEIETLIPPAYVQLKQSKEAASCNGKAEKEKEKSGNQPISKASTVEMAIDYIKSLQAELSSTRTRLTAAEAKLATGGDAKDVNGGKEASENGEKAASESKANTSEQHNPQALATEGSS
ncbi:hypothetical protein BDV06DRAFT_51930 [Aspergillus oleicola]